MLIVMAESERELAQILQENLLFALPEAEVINFEQFEALNTFIKKNELNLLILDLKVSEQNSKETLDELRKIYSGPLIVIENFSFSASEEHIVLEKTIFMQKPIIIDELENAIFSLLGT